MVNPLEGGVLAVQRNSADKYKSPDRTQKGDCPVPLYGGRENIENWNIAL